MAEKKRAKKAEATGPKGQAKTENTATAAEDAQEEKASATGTRGRVKAKTAAAAEDAPEGKARAVSARGRGKAQASLTTVPEWANSTAIAKLLGKTTRRIQQLTQDGVLETEIPPGGGARKYRTCETIQRYVAHIERKAQETGAASSTAELNLRKLEAEVELKESQGQLHKIKTAIAEGKYIPAAQATEELTDFMATFRQFAMAIPVRVSGTMATYTDAGTARATEKALRKELEAMLTAFVEGAAAESSTGNEP